MTEFLDKELPKTKTRKGKTAYFEGDTQPPQPPQTDDTEISCEKQKLYEMFLEDPDKINNVITKTKKIDKDNPVFNLTDEQCKLALKLALKTSNSSVDDFVSSKLLNTISAMTDLALGLDGRLIEKVQDDEGLQLMSREILYEDILYKMNKHLKFSLMFATKVGESVYESRYEGVEEIEENIEEVEDTQLNK